MKWSYCFFVLFKYRFGKERFLAQPSEGGYYKSKGNHSYSQIFDVDTEKVQKEQFYEAGKKESPFKMQHFSGSKNT